MRDSYLWRRRRDAYLASQQAQRGFIINPFIFAAGGGTETAQTWDTTYTHANIAFSNGNKTVTHTTFLINSYSTGTKSSGKYYFEVLIGGTVSTSAYVGTAVKSGSTVSAASQFLGYRSNGALSPTGVGGGPNATFTAGDVIGVALDFTGDTLKFYKNNSLQPDYHVSVAGTRCIAVSTNNGSPSYTIRTTTAEFSYSVPSGFSSWGSP